MYRCALLLLCIVSVAMASPVPHINFEVSFNPLSWFLRGSLWLGGLLVSFFFGYGLDALPTMLPSFLYAFHFVTDRTNRLYMVGLIFLLRFADLIMPLLTWCYRRLLRPVAQKTIKMVLRKDSYAKLQELSARPDWRWYAGPGAFYKGNNGHCRLMREKQPVGEENKDQDQEKGQGQGEGQGDGQGEGQVQGQGEKQGEGQGHGQVHGQVQAQGHGHVQGQSQSSGLDSQNAVADQAGQTQSSEQHAIDAKYEQKAPKAESEKQKSMPPSSAPSPSPTASSSSISTRTPTAASSSITAPSSTTERSEVGKNPGTDTATGGADKAPKHDSDL